MSYQITAKHLSEIRMGSPYYCASLEIKGEFVPDILSARKFAYTDVFLTHQREAYIAIWKIDKNNDPGFQILRLSENDKTLTISKRIEGCADEIIVEKGQDGIRVKYWKHPEGNKECTITEFKEFKLD